MTAPFRSRRSSPTESIRRRSDGAIAGKTSTTSTVWSDEGPAGGTGYNVVVRRPVENDGEVDQRSPLRHHQVHRRSPFGTSVASFDITSKVTERVHLYRTWPPGGFLDARRAVQTSRRRPARGSTGGSTGEATSETPPRGKTPSGSCAFVKAVNEPQERLLYWNRSPSCKARHEALMRGPTTPRTEQRLADSANKRRTARRVRQRRHSGVPRRDLCYATEAS